MLDLVVERLIGRGWDGDQVRDAITIMADHLASHCGRAPSARWRWVAMRLALPEWQARRLATLLLGAGGCPGLVELMTIHGSAVIDDPELCTAIDSTVSRRADGPRAHLETWQRWNGTARLRDVRSAAPGAPPHSGVPMPLAARTA